MAPSAVTPPNHNETVTDLTQAGIKSALLKNAPEQIKHHQTSQQAKLKMLLTHLWLNLMLPKSPAHTPAPLALSQL